MSSEMDPGKLKVVELRAELTKRGLDTKGNKAALVKRLKDVLGQELKKDLPDTSIADTSTEDLDSSQVDEDQGSGEDATESEEKKPPEEPKEDEKKDEPPKVINSPKAPAPGSTPTTPSKAPTEAVKSPSTPLKTPSTPTKAPLTTQVTATSSPKAPTPQSEKPKSEEVAPMETDDVPEPSSADSDTKNLEENADSTTCDKPEVKLELEGSKENGDHAEPPSKKSRWASDEVETVPSKQNEAEENDASKPVDTPKNDDVETKSEKRRRTSASPERVQRRRSKSPIKEDEPPIDSNKVQLSWYDSDLHLQLDKESFLSAKPYHDGAFGFAWAGVRATHGVSEGKVCFEVKITEELKLDDFSKYYDKRRHESQKYSEKSKTHDNSKKSISEKIDKKDVEDKKQIGEKSESVEKIESDEKKETDEKKECDENKESDEKEETDEKKESEDKATENGEADNTDETIKENLKEETKEHDEAVEKTEESMETDQPTETINKQQVQESEESPLPTHLFRVGWSVLDASLQLGEDKFSYGYESSGTFVNDLQFKTYGIKFGVGDVVTSFVSIIEDSVSISYAINGQDQQEAIQISTRDLPENFVLFPHVLSRNYAFELNLGGNEESWFPKAEPYEDYQFLDKIENKVAGPVRPENRSDCEVILMFGLPASGKTHWVKEYVNENVDKKYTLLGNTHLLEKMTVSGATLKSKFKGSWNILLDKLQKCINKLIEIAALRRRNYIIDQTNVFPSAQRRKLRPFEGFKRRVVVVVVGEEEQAKRQSLQEAQDGKDVPDSSVLEMKANLSLPQKGDWIDEVIYAGVPEDEAKSIVQKYNTQGREAGFGIQRRYSHRDDRRWQNRRNDYRGNYRDRNYGGRYDRGPPRQNWHPQRPGGWRDRRDHRGPPPVGGGSRDWRNRGGNSRDRNRDSQASNYSRNRNQQSRTPNSNWQTGSWHQGGGSQGNWNNQAWGSQGWNQGNWNQSQNQWKYGGGSSQNYGNYGSWGQYYGQYAQGWGSQAQTNPTAANQYGQYSQQEWAQYAQQYAQQGQNPGSVVAQPLQK